jgi:hypothetical protein
LYFKAYSLCEISHENSSSVDAAASRSGVTDGLDAALACCRDIQSIISSTKHFADQSLVCEIDPLILRIQKRKEVKTAAVYSTIASSDHSLTPLSSSSSLRDISTLIHESERSILMNQPLAAIKALKKCISLMQKRVRDGDDSLPDGRIVSCFQSAGDCYSRLQEYDEVVLISKAHCACVIDI